MKKYKALKSFSGLITMRAGEVSTIDDKNIVADLLAAGYIAEIKSEPTKKQKAKAKT